MTTLSNQHAIPSTEAKEKPSKPKDMLVPFSHMTHGHTRLEKSDVERKRCKECPKSENVSTGMSRKLGKGR